MEFANIAEFRQNAARVFTRVQKAGEVVVLRNGRPVGLLVAADSSTLDVFRVALQRARAQIAAERLRRTAAGRGRRPLAASDIDRLVRKARRERSGRR